MIACYSPHLTDGVHIEILILQSKICGIPQKRDSNDCNIS